MKKKKKKKELITNNYEFPIMKFGQVNNNIMKRKYGIVNRIALFGFIYNQSLTRAMHGKAIEYEILKTFH